MAVLCKLYVCGYFIAGVVGLNPVCSVGSRLCDKLVTHSEECYCVCDLEGSTVKWPRP